MTCTQGDMNSAAFQSSEPPSCRREYCMNVTGVDIYPLCDSYWNKVSMRTASVHVRNAGSFIYESIFFYHLIALYTYLPEL